MVLIPVLCPHCQSDQVIKGGKTKAGKQRYKCQNVDCCRYSFQLDLTYKGISPEVKEQIVDVALNGSGIGDTARVLGSVPRQSLTSLRKEAMLSSVNHRLLALLNPNEMAVVIWLAEAAELDELWSYVGKKQEQRWLWHAIDHRVGRLWRMSLGAARMRYFLKLKALLEPFGITHYYMDYWGAYRRHLEADKHRPGRRNA